MICYYIVQGYRPTWTCYVSNSAPVRDGCKFNGWYTAPAGGTKVAATTKVTGYLECYAQWSASIGLVVADGCDGMGTVSGGGVIAAGKKATLKATAPKNWMFVGWARPSDFNSNDNTVRLTMVSTDAKYTFSMPSPGEEADEVELTAVFTHVFGSAIVPDDEIEE